MSKNLQLYPWFQFFRNLMFWQAVWFLLFQSTLSAAEAITLYVIYDIATTVLEVPSGYMSDRLGRKVTLIISAASGALGCGLIFLGDGFLVFALGQALIGGSTAFASGTDSALLFESLPAEDRKRELERQELRAWRFGFTGLALGAFVGGVVAEWSPSAAFAMTAGALLVAVGVAGSFVEPTHVKSQHVGAFQQARTVLGLLKSPILRWFFVVDVGMYALSHVPYVFGQPFIQEALETIGLQSEAAVVSGTVSAAMMVISIGASWLAFKLHKRVGTAGMFLLALAMQICLIAVLALTAHPIAILFLLLRMVPDALVRPFLMSSVQPLLERDYRATYWSMKSLAARIVLAGTLYVGSFIAPDYSPLPHWALQDILVWYIAAGGALWIIAASKRKDIGS